MGNEKNLIPNSKRTPEELRAMTRKGGINSGKARRKKANLKKAFDKITKAVDRNTELRGFKSILETHPDWIPEILDYDNFKCKVWLGFLSDSEIFPLFKT